MTRPEAPGDRSPYPVPRKALGQNFLVHGPTLERIAGIVCRGSLETVIELGAGTGNLTLALAARCRKVIAVEVDERLIRWHASTGRLPENVELRAGDILRLSYERLALETGQRLTLAGNLPYNISTQVVFGMCRQARFVSEAYLLFQKEVAQRLTCPPGSRTYGILSVACQYSASAERLFDIPPSMFRPRPRVDSSLVRIQFKEQVEPAALDYDFFLEVVRASFAQRRKKIVNCLTAWFRQDADTMIQALEASDIDPGARAETVDPGRFAMLSNRLLDSFGDKA